MMGVSHVAILALLCVGALGQDGPLVVTESGPVRGKTVTLKDPKYNGIEIDSFYSIPFGADTGGQNRFKWPKPADNWTEEHDGTILGPACPQNQGPGMNWFTHPFWFKYSEDCLNMDVFAPTDRSRGPYAVMVWFHGGAYTGGFNHQYPGHFLAANDVVIVVPNYRLNFFGFLSVEDPNDSNKFYSEAPGNQGMMDQNLALQWVQANIHHFGGDPTRVTAFGQSAGAGSSALHTMSPLSKGLLHRAICESGSENNFWSVNWPEQDPNNYGKQVARRVGCDDTDPVLMVECFRSMNWTHLQDNVNISCSPGHFCQGFAPIVDGPGGFLPDYPRNLRERDEWNKVDLITGITREDGALYTLFLIPEANNDNGGFTHDEFHYYLHNNLLYMWRDSFTVQQQIDLATAIDWYYSPWPHLEDMEGNRQAFNKMITDIAFGMPGDRQAKFNSEFNNTYFYVMGMRPENTDEIMAEWIGVPHMGELPEVWGWPLLRYNRDVRFNSKIIFDIITWTCDEDAKWSYFFQEMWANFAKTGDPTPSPVKLPDTVSPDTDFTWTKLEDTTSEEGKLNYMYADNTDIYVGDGYRQRDYAFSREYGSYLGDQHIRKRRSAEKGPVMPGKAMKMGLFTESMARIISNHMSRKYGDRFHDLWEKSLDLETDQQYMDLLTPYTGIGRPCPEP